MTTDALKSVPSIARSSVEDRVAETLRNLIVHRRLAWYRGCGQLPGIDRRDDLETELASLVLRQSTAGRCRIDHLRDGRHHDDRAFALGAACLVLTEQQTCPDWLHLTPPDTAGGFAW